MIPKTKDSLLTLSRTPNLEGRFEKVRLDKNERLDALGDAIAEEFRRRVKGIHFSTYPEMGRLKQAIASRYKIPAEQIILGHGSGEVLDQVFAVFARRGSKVVCLSPSFAMYPIYAHMNEAEFVGVPCGADLKVDTSALVAALVGDVSILVIANPNSPTGTRYSREELCYLLEICTQKGILMLVDEAYYYFSNLTMIDRAPHEENLIVTRSFSKAFGLAGCRAGFMVGSLRMVKELQRARPLYEMNNLSMLAAEIALDFEPKVQQYVETVEEGKALLVRALTPDGVSIFPSYTNFINMKLPLHLDTGAFEDFGASRGVLFKGRLGDGAYAHCARITVGPPALMRRFVELYREFASA